jgi:RHS repeat-associated protein
MWTYNSAGRPVTTTYPNSEVLTHGYSSGGSLNTVTSMAVTYASGTLSFLIRDHLGSTSLSTDANGTVTSEQRYTACPLRSASGVLREGEVRFSSSDLPTQYTYTGQYSYATDFGLLFYNARWVDPYLNRWTQPDSIVPEPGNPQSWDRYSYALNNPVRYTDPSGHCPVCFVVGAGLILYGIAAIAVIAQTEAAKPVGNNASNIQELMKLGVDQADHANITGEGLQSLEDDPSVQGAESRIIAKIREKPEYGTEAFSIDNSNSPYDTFTADGPGRSWAKGLAEQNPAFLMMHRATLYATDTHVTADGTISTTWEARDQFDYIPDLLNTGGRSLKNYLAYNAGAIVMAPIYYGMLHARPQVRTTADWNQTIFPSAKNRNMLIPQ